MAASNSGRCPICRRPTKQAFRPFCSKRCADIDLARWLGGTYAIAGGGADADEDGEDAALASPSQAGNGTRAPGDSEH